MIIAFASLLLGGAVAATPCADLSTLKLSNATITSATLVPEGPPPARGGGGGGARGGAARGGQGQRGGAAPGAAPQAAGQQAAADGRGAAPAAGGRGGAPAAPPANIPAHCRLQMVLKPTSDSLINMELWLPTQNWNGKFMGVGNGGFAGSIQGLTNDMPQALRLGYATGGTDTGHQDPGGEWAIGHPEKLVDFAYRSTHEMTLKSKEIIKAFYDQKEKYAYFKGCSTGGRMALMEAQRYPDDYDGIIAGSLANRHIHMWMAGVARSIELSRHPEAAITAEKAALVNQMVKTCDVLNEGFLNNPRQCNVDFSKLMCPAGKDDNTCLTAPQLKTVETYYNGVKFSNGEMVFSGQALGNPIGAQRSTNQAPGGTFDLVRIAYNDPNYDWHNWDLDRTIKFVDEKESYVDAVNPDLSKFKSSGGKLLITHGWGDTTITPETSIWYYDSALKKMGQKQDNWMRLFMVPAMGHCGGGFAFDSIGTLEKWVEKGVAPEQMMGTYAAQGKTRPLCPYPQAAEYKGTGDIKEAANWTCKAPK